MKFTTITFIIFLVVVFAGHWTLRKNRSRNILLLLASYFFYGWWDYRFCSLLIISSVVDYCVGLRLAKTENKAARRGLLVISLVCNLGMLGFFKYFNFFADSFVDLFNLVGWQCSPVALDIVLPVGISFYTFQTLSYTIDVYRRRCPVCHDVVAFFTFVSFFPQLVAGPIERASHLLPQMINDRKFEYPKAVDGCRQILWGFFKKMVLADNLAPIANEVFSGVTNPGGPEYLLAVVCFAFQIYCDFSAYSDIAIGTARLFGVDLMQNFATPYFARNISDFWRRWHISLSTWFRDYVYIPLGGSKAGEGRIWFNLLATFTISGLWHGASWNYIIWGALNGVGLITHRAIFGKRKHLVKESESIVSRGLKAAPWAIMTFVFICIGWVFFRADTLGGAMEIFGKLCTDMTNGASWKMCNKYLSETPVFWGCFGVFYLIELFSQHRKYALEVLAVPKIVRWLIYVILAILILSVGATPELGQDFIYFDF